MVRILSFICICFSIFHPVFSQSMQKKVYTYLALGDSYTIGESLSLHDNFPNQTARLLSDSGYTIEPLTIVAKTGWTTEELQSGIANRIAGQLCYDIVSLLIGVNNQYRGGTPEEYSRQFEELIQQAIVFAKKNPARVFVMSIPDWGVTPYAQGRDRESISNQIDSFNLINRTISKKWGVNYIDITGSTRDAARDHSLIAADGLHPSAKEYGRWAEKLAVAIQQQFK
jgi:lysophospholipase L1-like esterase